MWLDAFNELVNAGFFAPTTSVGRYRITHAGFQLADTLKRQNAKESFSELAGRFKAFQNSYALYETPQGAKQVFNAQNRLFDLLEQRAVRASQEAPNLIMPHRRGEVPCVPRNKLQLSVTGVGGLSLEIEASRPTESSAEGAWCDIAVFRLNQDSRAASRHATLLEEHRFKPKIVGPESVSWVDTQNGNFSDQELCDFAFQRFRNYLEDWFNRAALK